MKRLLLILSMMVSVTAFSQNLTSLQYSMGFGSGDLSDYIDKPSFRGLTVDYRKMIQPNIGVGIELAWHVFYAEKGYDVYTVENLSYAGKQYRYNNQMPALVSADYFLKPDEMINPFVGFGLGTMYSKRNTNMGQYTLEEDAWHFALRPEAGILVKASDLLSFSVTGKYYHGFKAGDLPAQSYFSLALGFVFTE
jgi:outer membrane protein W